MTCQQYRKQETDGVTTVEWFIDFVMVYWHGHKGIMLPGNDVAVEKSKVKTCRFVESKNIVTVANCRPFSVSFCRLSVNQKEIVATFLSNVACHQNPLEGLMNDISWKSDVKSRRQDQTQLDSSSESKKK